MALLLVLGNPLTSEAQISGSVFRDFDLNGIRSDTLPIELGVAGVTVRAFIDLSKTPITTITDANGNYSFSSSAIPTGRPVRIEFDQLPTGDHEGPYGSSSGTRIQFVKAPASNINVGINYPSDYCQRTTIKLAVPCYVNGNTQVTTDINGNPVPTDKQSATADALVSLSYQANGLLSATNYPPDHLATGAEVGAIWALAYQRRTRKLFSAATVKRHTGFGPLGSGGIYITDINTGTTTNFVDVRTLGINTGDDPHSNLFGDKTQTSSDPGSMVAVGKVSFGGMDMSEDDKTLYFINLNDRKLYSLFVDAPARVPTAADVKSWTIPDPGCSNGDFRPWAIKVYRGKIYVGVICSAERSQQQGDLRATIYRLDPNAASPTFENVLSFPLDFRRGAVDSTTDPVFPANTCSKYDRWLPWSDAWPTPCGLGENPVFVMYPQPMLTDLEFDDDGSMLIGFLDRFGQMAGVANHDPQGNGFYDGFTGGDLLRAYTSNGTFVLEKNGNAGNRTGSGVGNNEGPVDENGVGGEFYGKDNWFFIDHIAHAEVTNGALALVPGYNEVVTSAFDPIENVFKAGGLKVFSNTTGGVNRNVVLYTNNAGAFGKASGLGDIKALCDPAWVEIGNRIWFDDNRDGIQDPYEPGIDGIVLTLHDMEDGGKQIASQISRDGGQFYFNNTTVPGGLSFAHKYEIWMDTTQLSGLDITLTGMKSLNTPGGRLAAQRAGGRQAAVTKRYYSLSPTDQSDFPDADLRDSDAYLRAGYAAIPVTTRDAGQNDFTHDLGIYSCPELSNEKDTLIACPNKPIDLISVKGKYFSRLDSVRFVVFTALQSGTAMYGSGGEVLGTVKPDANNRVELPNPALNTNNNTSTVSAQYVYAIIYPTPENPACRQSSEIVVLTRPAISASAVGGTLTCSVNEVTLQGRAHYGDGSIVNKSVVYAWIGPNGFTSTQQNPVVSAAGMYTLTITTQECSDIQVSALAEVTADTIKPDLIAYGGALPCRNCTTTLYAEAPGATLLWTGPSGFTSTIAEPEVSVPGEYTVTATVVNGCAISATVDLLPSDGGDPCPDIVATAVGTKLTCTIKEATLQAGASYIDKSPVTSGLTYSWNGPLGFTSTQQNPLVSAAGTYTVAISSTDCPNWSSSITAEVVADTAKPTLVVHDVILPCRTCTTTLYAEAPDASLIWAGPNGFSSTAAEPEVSLLGEYMVTAKGANGCEISKVVELKLSNHHNPCLFAVASAIGGTLTCKVKEVSLKGNASNKGRSPVSVSINYSWKGPNGFTSTQQNPVVSRVGTYTLTISSPDCPGWLTSTLAVVVADTTQPDLVAYGGALPCRNCKTTVYAEISEATLLWSGPVSFTSTVVEPEVSIPGEYTVTATGANGCQTIQMVDVLPVEGQDPCMDIQVSAVGGKLTCTTKEITLQGKVSDTNGSNVSVAITYNWSGPNSFSSSAPNPVVSIAGTYTLVITSLECPDWRPVALAEVTVDTAKPVLVAYGSAQPCVNCTTALSAEAPGASLVWKGPQGFGSTEAKPVASLPGVYTVTASSANGCQASLVVELAPYKAQDPCLQIRSVCLPVQIRRSKQRG